MKNVFHTLRLRTASIEYLNCLRRQALEDQRNYAMPNNPRRAVPGLEPEWEKAREAVACINFLLRETERKELRERRKAKVIQVLGAYGRQFLGAAMCLAKVGLLGIGMLSIMNLIGPVPFLAVTAVLAAVAVCREFWHRE